MLRIECHRFIPNGLLRRIVGGVNLVPYAGFGPGTLRILNLEAKYARIYLNCLLDLTGNADKDMTLVPDPNLPGKGRIVLESNGAKRYDFVSFLGNPIDVTPELCPVCVAFGLQVPGAFPCTEFGHV